MSLKNGEEITTKISTKSVGFNITHSVELQYGIRRSFLSVQVHCDEIKIELANLATGNNLLLILIYVLLLTCMFSTSLQYATTSSLKEKLTVKKKWLGFYVKTNHISSGERQLANVSDQNTSIKPHLTSYPGMGCENHFHDDTLSATNEFDLGCDRTIFRSFNCFSQLGFALGALPSGIAADIRGRRPVFIYGALMILTGGSLIPVAPNMLILILGRLIMGMGISAVFITLLVIFTELCRNPYRSCLTIIAHTSWHVGIIISRLIFPRIVNWRLLELASEFPFLLIIYGTVFVPESPRWLMIRGRWQTAWNVLHDLGSTATTNMPNQRSPAKTIVQQLKVFAKSYFRYRLCTALLISGVGSLTHYAILSIEKRIRQLDPLLTQMACMEIIAIFLASVVAYNCRRRTVCCGLFLLLAGCFISALLVNSRTVKDVSLIAAEIFSSTLHIITIVYVLEMFPTTHRATTLGFNVTVSRLTILTYLLYQYERPHTTNLNILRGCFCGLNIVCALIVVLGSNTYDEIIDTKESFFTNIRSTEDIVLPLNTL